ncbi:MAG: toxin HipA [Eubacteriales bacterium]|nr:toxin HipA [Eubacteriales bacterium]
MPLIKKTDEERRHALLGGSIRKHMNADQVTKKQMGAITGMAPETFAQKTNHPERFTYPQLVAMFHKLKFTDEEILEVMR